MDITTFKICRRIVNGCGSFYGNIAEEAASLNGHRIFLVCDPILAKLGLTEKTAALLREKGFEVAIHADVEPEPRVESVLAAAEQARAFGADCVIGIGGGSSLDTAKTCSVLLGNQQDIRELYGIEKVSKPGAPLILVPTSAGTGSEVTDIAILSDEAAQLKMGIVSRHMLPASVILDPELPLSLPKGPTAASGMDALIHAMEAYTSIHATPLTDMWAEHAIALIAPNLRKAWARGEDIQARQAMLTGSFYAGVAFCNAGVTAVHAFAYPIGARYHIPHGLANTLMLLPLLLRDCAFAAPAQDNPDEEKIWRVIYVEGGPFSDYQRIFQGLALGLEERGLIENGHVPLPKDSEEARGMWEWLHQHAGGKRLVFLADGFYSANWDSQQREKVRQEVLRRIREKKDVDMVLAFGTWAGQDLAAQDLPVPVIVSSVTNAVDAGIIPSVEDSGRDNLVAPIEPDRFKRQVLLFHDIFAFQKLGIAYEDTPAGRGSIALNEIEDAARELGITLLRCTDTFDIQDTDLASERLLACHKKLVDQGAEAVYLTYNVGLQAGAMRRVLQPLADAHVPTFSQLGAPDVIHGALLSVAQSNTAEEGRFSAGLMEAILKGARPRDLSPVFESPVSMALNLFMATLIGWNPPLEVLAAVDEFYQEMK